MGTTRAEPGRSAPHVRLPAMQGRVCVVTGPTSGIGEVVARELARAGAALWLVARDREWATELERTIRGAFPGTDVRTVIADLSLLSEVRRTADEIAGSARPLHLLVNNAGAVFSRREVTREGHERTWALNVLAPFLLTGLLTDSLVASAPARIVNVASSYHRWGRMHFD
ncbi:MAG: SDR family NAD(P)-dependent oxidoreductase, partial [Thermoplasmata archaeon]|nr:SDR family NAD(P)-dependent oxidoreductase [Thermoplasmata archaeon]